jgi:sugar phosphate isomerase/epimerase
MDGVELFADIDADSPERLAQIYGSRDLGFFSMTPANVDIAHVDREQRLAGIRYYERLITFAAALGCPRVTCHEAVGRTHPQDNHESEWARLVDSCRHLANWAADCSVQLAFEPLHRGLVSQIHRSADLVGLLDAVEHQALAAVVDTFHMDLEEGEPTMGIKSLEDRVALVQLADRGRKALGTGGAPLAANLSALVSIGYGGPWVLECNPQLPGPSLERVPLDQDSLDRTLRESLTWLRACLA